MFRPRRKVAQARCPICGRARDEKFKPFCSKHCADVDLARWLEGRYVIPVQESDQADEEAAGKTPED
jgi:hypothetical protein